MATATPRAARRKVIGHGRRAAVPSAWRWRSGGGVSHEPVVGRCVRPGRQSQRRAGLQNVTERVVEKGRQEASWPLSRPSRHPPPPPYGQILHAHGSHPREARVRWDPSRRAIFARRHAKNDPFVSNGLFLLAKAIAGPESGKDQCNLLNRTRQSCPLGSKTHRSLGVRSIEGPESATKGVADKGCNQLAP